MAQQGQGSIETAKEKAASAGQEVKEAVTGGSQATVRAAEQASEAPSRQRSAAAAPRPRGAWRSRR